ncbi:hypothetical protein L2E82_15363 [Cichorium intybus]|uniref:Uncharacterized protein n=1 Tax=Cichorium intybus TaxID=13427 RepID=A0ACB9F3H8_CICIN|nr:hypothetical protein L2E82_15363 [Cichorium intybus]
MPPYSHRSILDWRKPYDALTSVYRFECWWIGGMNVILDFIRQLSRLEKEALIEALESMVNIPVKSTLNLVVIQRPPNSAASK